MKNKKILYHSPKIFWKTCLIPYIAGMVVSGFLSLAENIWWAMIITVLGTLFLGLYYKLYIVKINTFGGNECKQAS